jgi:predicted nuclease of predicted toxin-antitoxin system
VGSGRNQSLDSSRVKAKFLADENFPKNSLLALQRKGIEVKSVIEYKKSISDEAVLNLAIQRSRILITFDQDFGELVFRRKIPSKGIILLRFEPQSSQEVTKSLLNLFSSGIKLENCFTVVEKDRIRSLPYPRRTN